LGIFDDFRKRADGKDGTPAALKESTHLYRTRFTAPPGGSTPFSSNSQDDYPLFSIDLFTCKEKDKQEELTNRLKAAASAVEASDLLSWHVLESTDSIVCACVGTWTSVEGYTALKNEAGYSEFISDTKRIAVLGTFSDLMEKTDPSHSMYSVADIFRVQDEDEMKGSHYILTKH